MTLTVPLAPLSVALTSLETIVLRPSSGPALQAGDRVLAYYEGTLASNGSRFDGNYDFTTFTPVTGRQSFEFTLGAGQVIQGWDQAFPKLTLGEIAEIRIPAALAYGSTARSGIPANSDLIFKVMPIARIPAGQAINQENLESVTYADLGVAAPAPPSIEGFLTAAGGLAEGPTDDASPTLSLLADPGTTVTVLRDGTEVGQAEELQPGQFQYTSPDLALGSYVFSAISSITNAAEIAPLPELPSDQSSPLQVTVIDTLVAPTSEEIPTVIANPVPAPIAAVPIGAAPIAVAAPIVAAASLDSPGTRLPIPEAGAPADVRVQTSSRWVSEGSPLLVQIKTNLAKGTSLYYEVEGAHVNQQDLSRGSLVGSRTVGRDGWATLRFELAADQRPEGSENLQIKVFGDPSHSQWLASSKTITVLDTSTGGGDALAPSAGPGAVVGALFGQDALVNGGAVASGGSSTAGVVDGAAARMAFRDLIAGRGEMSFKEALMLPHHADPFKDKAHGGQGQPLLA